MEKSKRSKKDNLKEFRRQAFACARNEKKLKKEKTENLVLGLVGGYFLGRIFKLF